MPSDEIEKILEPKRLVRIFGKVFLAVILCLILVVGVRMSVSAMNTVEATSHDHAWFKAQTEEIRSLESRIAETRHALAAHKKEVDSRWVSRSDDRAQTTNLTQNLISMQEQCAGLIRDYNVAADLATDKLGGLPHSVSSNSEGK